MEKYLKHFNLKENAEIKKYMDEIFKDDEYIFMTTKDKKQYGYCSSCKSSFRVNIHVKHNDAMVCPKCQRALVVKEARYGKKCLKNDCCIYWFEKSKKDPMVITCRGCYVAKEYEKDYRNPNYEISDQALYVFDTRNNRSKMFTYNYWGGNWYQRGSVFDFTNGWLSSKFVFCQEKKLEEALQGTMLQYSRYKDILGSNKSTVRYIAKFNKYSFIEQLEKMGFNTIVSSIVSSTVPRGTINYKGKDIFKKLKLNRGEVKEIRRLGLNKDFTPQALKIYQQNKANGFNACIKAAVELDNIGYNITDLSTIIKFSGIEKALKYANEQWKKDNKYFYYKGAVIREWADYLDCCSKLNANMKDKSTIFPKDLKKEHNNVITEVKVQENKELDQKICRRTKTLINKYFFKDNKFLIRPALGAKDLIEEGTKLHHCVAVCYMEPYANGKTDILLIRRKSQPNKPLVTVEVKNGSVIQAYGNHDTIPKKDVQAFIKKFKKNILEKIKNKKKVEAA